MSDSINTEPFDIVCGLGNPGQEHEQDRHNAGFWFIDALARELGADFSSDRKAHARVAKARLGTRNLVLVKPMNYMNRSGQSLAAVAQFYKVPAARMLVVHDELDLGPGAIRLKEGGGHGGHNGLRDIINRCGAGFWRLRIGVGHPGHKDKVVGHVLKPPTREERNDIDDAINAALRTSRALLNGEVRESRQSLHALKSREEIRQAELKREKRERERAARLEARQQSAEVKVERDAPPDESEH